MRPSRRRIRMILVTAFTVGLLAATAVPASAHVLRAFHGSDQAWVNADHNLLVVQDGECDGNYVYAEGFWYDVTIHGSRFVTVTDVDGCDGLAWQSGFKSGDFTQFRVCETGVGCSAWKTVT